MRRKDFYALILLAGLSFLLFREYLFVWPTPLIYPESSLGTDLPREIWPLAYFVKDRLLTMGVLPLWRPYLLSGAPLIGHPVAPILYPPHWLVLLLPLATAFNFNLALHIVWMGVGTYLYLRWDTDTRWEAALVGALIFCQAPKWVAHISGGHLPMVAAIAWWPWVWLGANRYWTTGKIRWSVLVGGALAAQVLNHGMFAVLSVLALGACTLSILVIHRGRGLRRLVLGYAFASLIAMGLSAGQLFPFFELVGYSTRARITFEEAAFGSLPPLLLLNALFPPVLKFPEWFLYPGVGVLALVTYVMTTAWSKRNWIASIVVVMGVILSLGSYTPLFRLLYNFLPGYSALRVPARWWIFSLFALALLSAWALEKWLADNSNSGSRRNALMVVIVSFYSGAVAIKMVGSVKIPFDILPGAILMILALLILWSKPSKGKLVVLVLLIAIDLSVTTDRLLRPEPEARVAVEDPIVSLLQTAALDGERSFAPYGSIEASRLVKFDLRAADGYDSFILDDYSKLGGFASGCLFSSYSTSVPPTASNPKALEACPHFLPQMQALALLNVRYVIVPASLDVPGLELMLEDDGLRVYRLEPGFGRAFGVVKGSMVTPDKCIDSLAKVNLAAHVVVEEELPFEPQGSPPVVILSRKTPNSETFQVQVSHNGVLVRSESWAPGWKAYVDGKPTRLIKANCALQGVWLEPGSQTVTFKYAPTSYSIGLWISVGAVLFLLAWLVVIIIYSRFYGSYQNQ